MIVASSHLFPHRKTLRMIAIIALLLCTTPVLLQISEACLFRSFVTQPGATDEIWDEESHARKVHNDCQCGVGPHAEDMDKPWHVYIHSKIGPSSSITCSGTIITSNLIVTSHSCLTLEGRTISVYDTWKPNGGVNTVNKLDIVISEKLNNKTAGRGIIFEIEEIIVNPHFAQDSSVKKYPRNDFVLIKLKDVDFTSRNSTLKPICVPPYSPGLDFVHRPAYYYGVGVMGQQDPNPIREIRENNDTLKVRMGKECDEELDIFEKGMMANNRTYCLRYFARGPDLTPESPGGPLVTDTVGGGGGAGGSERTFLIGIATKVGHLEPNGIYKYEYFSSIVPVIKYFEYEAARAGSVWCDTPPLDLKPVIPPTIPGKSRDGPWPWELMAPVQRNESLDCDCGVANTDISGKIVGGVTATPYEFGWMARMYIFHEGKKRGANLCGGSIINDRLVLTAAHCLVSDAKISKKLKRVHVAPDNLDVTINVHYKGSDPKGIRIKVASVLFYPDYVESRKKVNFDYDIALLVLSEPLTFPPSGSKGIRPICLPKMGEPEVQENTTVTVVGWGLTNPKNTGSTANQLQKIDIPIATLDFCRSVAEFKITERMICAGTLDMYKDAAAGDSGGPLMMKKTGTNYNQWTEVGIVSWGEDSVRNGTIFTAALYSNVQALLPYVDYHAKRLNANWCRSS